MAKTRLKPVSVYMSEAQYEAIDRAAKLEHRSVSNLLLTLGLSHIEAKGIVPIWTQQSAIPRARLKPKKPTRTT